jgi:N-methylhydantoinase A
MKAVMHKQSSGVDGTRQVYFPGISERVPCRILDRSALAAAGSLEGPAIIEDPESTILALPGDRLSMSERGDVIIDINVKDNG